MNDVTRILNAVETGDAEATDEFGFCGGTTYKEWKQPTRQKGVSMKGKTFSHTKLWDYKYK